jgi:hypothetical protein
MRFLENGADIPNDLIRTVNEGTVTFLCGAGVSFDAGFPSFKELAEWVYERLSESWESEPAERKAMVDEEYDRALRSLEKRTHLPKTASRVRDAVSERLAAPTGPFPNHRALLQLSRDSDGRPRVLTTNFDTLFEHAAVGSDVKDIPSHACKSLPRPGGAQDFGILHLHGRIADKSLGLCASDLVLTSADFGDSYLRDGWASQYIEDRMRLGPLVLVGYAAEDAAMRLLLETLDADRDHFRDLKNIYSFDKETAHSASLWKAKGIISIEFSDYKSIYATLSEWARYASDPAGYRRARIQEILVGSPAGSAS